MRHLFVLALLLFSLPSYAWTSKGKAIGILELEKLSMEAKRTWFLYDPYIPEYTSTRYPGERRTDDIHGEPGIENFETWLYGTGVLFDINMLRYHDYALFWRNNVYMNGTTVQVRQVAWEWELGLDLWKDKLEIFYHHESRHVLERPKDRVLAPHENYPLLDELVLRMTFYTREK